jgi:hypothetical protein
MEKQKEGIEMRNKNSITYGLAMIVILLLSACNLVGSDDITIIGSDKVSVGQSFTLIATTPASAGQEIQTEIWTWDGVEYPASGQKFQYSDSEWVFVSLINLTAPDSPGVYLATYAITLIENDVVWTGEASFEVEVVELEETEIEDSETTGNCPAAPAIATDYMRSSGVKPGSQDWKSVISPVAQETGVNGDLWAGESCEPGYYQRVIDFVDNLLGR